MARCWRLEDIILSALILSIIAVPMLLIALGIKLTSPGPVIFKQQRYGLDGRRIRIWKFRRKIGGYMPRRKVKPGSTGWAQVDGWRGETDLLVKMEKRIQQDLGYIRNWSLLLDLKPIAMTTFVGLGDGMHTRASETIAWS